MDPRLPPFPQTLCMEPRGRGRAQPVLLNKGCSWPAAIQPSAPGPLHGCLSHPVRGPVRWVGGRRASVRHAGCAHRRAGLGLVQPLGLLFSG